MLCTKTKKTPNNINDSCVDSSILHLFHSMVVLYKNKKTCSSDGQLNKMVNDDEDDEENRLIRRPVSPALAPRPWIIN